MWVFNITTKVDISIADQWLLWQKETNVTEIMKTGLFEDYKLFKLLDQDADEDNNTFILQLIIVDLKNYDTYINHYADLISQKAFEKWGAQFISFKTIMQSVQ